MGIGAEQEWERESSEGSSRGVVPRVIDDLFDTVEHLRTAKPDTVGGIGISLFSFALYSRSHSHVRTFVALVPHLPGRPSITSLPHSPGRPSTTLASPSPRAVSVRCQFLEVHNEEVRDLLNPSDSGRDVVIREGPSVRTRCSMLWHANCLRALDCPERAYTCGEFDYALL